MVHIGIPVIAGLFFVVWFVCICVAMHLRADEVEVGAVVYAQIEVTQRRFQLEKSKSAQQRAPERLEELQNSCNEVK